MLLPEAPPALGASSREIKPGRLQWPGSKVGFPRSHLVIMVSKLRSNSLWFPTSLCLGIGYRAGRQDSSSSATSAP